MSLITNADVAVATRRTLTDVDEQFLSLMIPGIEADAGLLLKRSFPLAQVTETLVPDEGGYVWPTHTPIATVVSLTVGGVALSAGAFVVEPSRIRLDAPPISSVTVAPGPVTAVVRYTAGLTGEKLAAVRQQVLTRVSRIFDKFRDDVLGTESMHVDRQYVVQYMSEGWTPDEEKVLRRVRGTTLIDEPVPARDLPFGWRW